MDADAAEDQAQKDQTQKKPISRAVVIGINEYKNEKPENLSGAVQDATEVRDILKTNGGFIIDDEHFLTDGKATSVNIRRAISDLFWKTEQCDIALFYFAGHGRRDHLEHGYLLPHDADYDAPFVNGIRIQELKELFLRSIFKTTGIMILDCCFSGIATRSGPDGDEHIESFRKELRLENTGSGRFILASADADKTAREEEREHALKGGKHVHGLFSFQLIEGLMLCHKDDEFGRVSLGALAKYVEDAFKDDPKHKPQLNNVSASGAHDIFLTTIEKVLKQRLKKRLLKVKKLIAEKTPIALMVAIQELDELEKKRVQSQEASKYLDHIERTIEESGQIVFDWWIENNMAIYRQTANNEWYELLDQVLPKFELSVIRQLGAKKMSFVSRVIQAIKNNDPQSVANEIRKLDRDSQAVPESEAIGKIGLLVSSG